MAGVPYHYILRNLRVRKLTTMLTAGGMALVVFVFEAVLMLSEGLKATPGQLFFSSLRWQPGQRGHHPPRSADRGPKRHRSRPGRPHRDVPGGGLEEESSEDQDYYINEATLEIFEGAGADPALVTMLRTADVIGP